jgi:TatD DNase family protein
MSEFYDTHAHLDYPEFAADFPAVLERAHAAGVTRIIAIGTDADSSRRVVELAEQHEMIFAVVGWHPNDAAAAPDDVRPLLRSLASHPRVVALGETGLDYYRLPSTRGGSAAEDALIKQRQAELFRQHLEVAAETGLNCVIHQRGECFADTLALLAPFAGCVRGQFHCFAGTRGELEQVLALNSLVSFTGIATFKNGQNVREVIASAPAGKFMLETDCPFLAPVPFRGQRCEPAFVREIAHTAAAVRGCSREELSRMTCAAAREFFRGLH